jgi:hypothetical protein
LLAHGRWFSPSTPVSSTTKTGRHDIAKILLKVALTHQKSNQIKSTFTPVSSTNKTHRHDITESGVQTCNRSFGSLIYKDLI